jgi:hypothetical protein
MKKFVYKYTENNKEYWYYVDDIEGDLFVLDINDARMFSEKEIKLFDLDNVFSIGDEIFCLETNTNIVLKSLPIKIELNLM